MDWYGDQERDRLLDEPYEGNAWIVWGVVLGWAGRLGLALSALEALESVFNKH